MIGPLTADEVERVTTEVIWPRVKQTPTTTSAGITARTGCSELVLKLENQQRTGSFKIRGATARVAALTDAERRCGVITASAGNHAQGVALAARDAGVHATVYMPRQASIAKIQATEGYGAEVVLEGANFDEAVAAATARAASTGEVFISAYDDDHVICGQGSLGVELLRDIPDLSTLLIPIGGGGLFSGVAGYVKSRKPSVRVIGVQAEGSNGAALSFRAGALTQRTEPVATIADGIAVKSPSARTFAYIQRYADDVVTVSDESIADAVMLMLTRAKALVEPSGAAGVAALLQHPGLSTGTTAAVLCGGNIDVKLLSDLVERSMIRADRYLHIFTSCPDKPGGLARLLDAVASEGGNVMHVVHNRISPDVRHGQTGVELLIEVRNREHIERLVAALGANGYPVRRLD